MLVELNLRSEPFFSVCIPQYNRTSFLLKALDCLRGQNFPHFEICIADDCSPDGRRDDIIAYCQRTGLSVRYLWQTLNVRYDKNLRSSLSLATGRYCLLMGNDDMLASASTLQALHDEIRKHQFPGVVITNYRELSSGADFIRMRASQIVGSGPGVAAGHYRNFSFVSGILLDRTLAQQHATDRWDGSEMYQMYLGCRIIAAGDQLLGLKEVMVWKDIQIPGESADSYARKRRIENCPIQVRQLPMSQIGMLVADAIDPYVTAGEREPTRWRIFKQLVLFTYPFWIVEYRRIQSWRYALGICLGMHPRIITRGLNLHWLTRWRIKSVYTLVTLLGLVVPIELFLRWRSRLYTVAKSLRF